MSSKIKTSNNIRNKLITLMVSIVSMLIILCSMIIYDSLKIMNHIKILNITVAELQEMVSIRLNIHMLMTETLGGVLKVNKDDKKLQELEESIEKSQQALIGFTDEHTHLGAPDHKNQMKVDKELRVIYAEIETAMNSMFELLKANRMDEAYETYEHIVKPLVDISYLGAIEELIDEETIIAKSIYNKLLQKTFSTPWVIEKIINNTEEAKNSLETLLAARMAYGSINKLTNEILEFLLFGVGGNKNRVEHLLVESGRDFLSIVDLIEENQKTNPEVASVDMKNMLTLSSSFSKLVATSKDIFAAKENNEFEKGQALAKNKLLPLVNKTILPALMIYLDNNRRDIKDTHNKMLSVVKSATLQGVALLLLLTIIISVTTYIFIKNLIDSLEKLKTGAASFGSGNLDFRIGMNAGNELGEIAVNFNVMADDISRVFKLIEKAKREWESTMDCIHDIVILVDTKHNIIRCNHILAKLTQTPYRDLIGMNWETLMHEQDMDIYKNAGEIKEVYHKGSKRWFNIKMSPYSADGSKVSGTVVTLNDTTELRELSEELIEKNKKLEDAYSTLKATQLKIFQQEKMASIGQLAAGVAHEINNPIGFIYSNLGTLGKYTERLAEFVGLQTHFIDSNGASEDTADELNTLKASRKKMKLDYIMEDVAELITESQDGADRVKTIVENLKSFSRVDQAQHELSSINACIESTLNIVWNELKYKVEVHKDLMDIPMTACFPQQINQVAMNLLVNAGHAIEKKGDIWIKSWNDEECVYFSVKDNGKGIDPDVQSNIFEPFFTTKDVGKGTGLGLSITYDIIKKHKGTITVESTLGEGSTFTVSLPIVDKKEVDNVVNSDSAAQA